MKNIFHLLLPPIVFLFGAINLQAQIVHVSEKGNSALYAKDTVAEIKSFSAIYNSGRMYLKWIVANQHSDGIYILFRSSDGEQYETIGCKKGIGVPIASDIAYYFTDKSPCDKTAYYKLLHIGDAPNYILSTAISVMPNQEEILWGTK